jgi:Ca2+-binding RTX toxin-like protein
MIRPLLAALVAAVALIAAPAASASITLTYSGTTIGITGTGDNASYIAIDDGDSTFTIRNSTGVTNNSVCVAEVTPTLGTYYHCPGAAETLNAVYGAGNDLLSFENCIHTVVASMGDGANTFQLPDGCPDSHTSVTAGSGNDVFNGGSGPDSFDGGDGADQLRGFGGNDTLHGGAGNDTDLSGGDGSDQVFGDDGDDTIHGGAGNDTEDGGNGNDLFGGSDPDGGADDIHGGPGADKLDLDSHANGATITLDDVADDGVPGEGDNVHSDVENIYGTRGADTITGTAGPNVIDGGFGADTIRGGAGDDTLTGNSEPDALFGEAGNDTLYGGDGDDKVDGGPGTDSLYGDYSSCSAFGCAGGNDQIFARDGEADAVNCGAGADTAQVDASDTVGQDGFQLCETVDRPAPAPGPTPGPTPTPGPAALAGPTLQKATTTGGKKRLTVAFTLSQAATITVTVTRVGAKKALGKVMIKAKAGRTTRVVRKVGKKTLKAGRYRVKVSAGTSTKSFTVKVT